MKTAIHNELTAIFERQKKTYEKLQRSAWNSFEEKGWPSGKDEEYKFTPIQQILEKDFDFGALNNGLSLSKKDTTSHFYDIEGHHLVFVNGEYKKHLSQICEDNIQISGFDELGITEVESLIKSVNDQRASVSFNKAFVSNGLVIRTHQASSLLPIFIYHFRGGNANSVSCPFINISVTSNANLKIYEKSFPIGNVQNLSSHLTTVSVAKYGSLRYTKIQDHSKTDFTIDNLFVDQEEKSHFYANTFSFSGKLIRNNLEIALHGEHAEANMYGLYLLDNKSHVDNHTVVDHKFPNCDSNEMYKGIVDEKATGVFNGKIFVRQPAQKTNAFQANNNISLSDTAIIHSKPQLEIWADDVKCSHGCTVGQLDEEALFYLQSRGIRRSVAKAMLLNAFAEESLRHIHLDLINEQIVQMIHDRLEI